MTPLSPFRGEFSVVFACEDMEHADEAYQGMIGMLGGFGEIQRGSNGESQDSGPCLREFHVNEIHLPHMRRGRYRPSAPEANGGHSCL